MAGTRDRLFRSKNGDRPRPTAVCTAFASPELSLQNLSAMGVLLWVVLWSSLALVVYAYAGYAIVLSFCARWFGRDERMPDAEEARLPFLSVLVAAHNEQAVIAERIQNALAMDYPADRFEVVIASDGSDDDTCGIVRRCGDPRVRLLAYHARSGKAAVLNRAFRELRGDVVVLSDANTFTDPKAARRLARWFCDPSVGVVSGRLILTDPATGNNVDSLYWRYETFLKKCENRLGALLGANGAIYAIRRDIFTGLRANTAVDDFVIPLLARIRSGCRLVYDIDAVAYEETPAEVAVEFRRRSRIGAGGFQSLQVLRPLLDPRRGWIAFTFWSHKVLRWTCPFFLVSALVSSVALAGHNTTAAAVLLAQLFAYGVAAVGHALRGERGPAARAARLTTMFASMNLALLVGFWMWAAGRQGGVWQRTVR
jgi:cellulose synthase/poly-beta-1,6-N-acetylglucosamine synthase-like glycosyltransferase